MPLEPYMTAAVGIWLFALGAAIGSFLNVVVYRLPAGQSLVHPGSRCPRCGHAIRWHDNLPIVGWLLLKGRCRDCREPISPRYPLVELLVAAMFVVLAAAQWCEATASATPDDASAHAATAEATLRGDEPGDTPTDAPRDTPRENGDRDAAAPWAPASAELSALAARYAFHLLLLCVLLAVGLMAADGSPLPIGKPRYYFVVGACILTMYWPALRTPTDLLAGWVEPDAPRRAALWAPLANLWVGLLLDFAVRRAKLAPAARFVRTAPTTAAAPTTTTAPATSTAPATTTAPATATARATSTAPATTTATMSYSGLLAVAVFLGGVAAAVVGIVALLLSALLITATLARPAPGATRRPHDAPTPRDAAAGARAHAFPLAGVWLLSVWGATFIWLTGPALAGRPWPQWGFYGSWLLAVAACVALRGGCAGLRWATNLEADRLQANR